MASVANKENTNNYKTELPFWTVNRHLILCSGWKRVEKKKLQFSDVKINSSQISLQSPHITSLSALQAQDSNKE